MRFDEQLQNFNQNNVIFFEEIIQNKENFVKFAKLLDDQFSEENLNFDDFFNKIGKNVKSYNGITFWPDAFKDYFFRVIKDKKLYNFYQRMDYITN